MSRLFSYAALVAVFSLIAIQPLAAAHHEGYKHEALDRLKNLEEKFVGLAEAMPAGKYSFKPEGARSVHELFLHVASANYGIARAFGKQPPEGLDLRGMAKSIKDKAGVVAKVTESFAHMREAVNGLDDNESKAMKMFGQDTTQRGALAMMLGHSAEHLGQAIAYARVNGVTPPWSE